MRNFVDYLNYSYSGGMNDTDDIRQIAAIEAVLIQNAYIRNKGKLIKRNGTLLVGNDAGTTAICGLTSWTTPAGVKYFLIMSGTTLYYLNSSTWTAMDNGFTTGLDTTFVPANRKLYIFNGTENTHSWDGASVTLNSCLTDLGASIPTGKYAFYWKNYMFVWGSTKIGSTSYSARCYFSNIGAPDTFTTATDWFDVNKVDGQTGTGIFAIDKFLVLGKEKSIYIMTGTNPTDWIMSATINNLSTIDSSVGVASHGSMTQVGDDIWFMGSDGMIRSVRRNEQGSTPLTGIVSGKVRTTLATMNKTNLSKVAAVTFEGRVYFAFPTASYNNRVLVADTSISLEDPYNPHPWVLYTGWNPAMWAIYAPSSTPQLYFGEASADSLTFQAETGTTDNTAAIDMDYKSPLVDLQKPDMRKTYRFMYVSGQSGGNYDITVYTSIDGTTYTTEGTLNLSAGSTWGADASAGVWDTSVWGYGTQKRQKFTIQKASTSLQVRLRNNAASQPITLYPWTLLIKPKKIK